MNFRYILVDWLAEVAAMKMFSTHTFHVAVGVVDRFLLVNTISRSKLQLLGVSAMVLCSRYDTRCFVKICYNCYSGKTNHSPQENTQQNLRRDVGIFLFFFNLLVNKLLKGDKPSWSGIYVLPE